MRKTRTGLYEPTQEEIRQQCEQFRRTWSAQTRLARIADDATVNCICGGVNVPLVSLDRWQQLTDQELADQAG